MGVQNSLYTFTGKVGTIHGYTHKHKPGITYVAKNGGPTRDQFLNDPGLLLTRQNSVEFSGANLGAKNIYKFITFDLRRPLSGSYRFFLRNIIKLIHQDTTGLRGQRSVLFHNVPNLFPAIIVGKNCSEKLFSNYISSGFSSSLTGDRSSILINFSSGILPGEIISVTNATHIKLSSMIFGIPNLSWDIISNSYFPDDDLINRATNETGYFDVTVGSGGAFTLNPTLGIVPNASQGVLVILWVNYYELVSGVYNLLDNSADIILVAS
jgi:hypothetical protein